MTPVGREPEDRFAVVRGHTFHFLDWGGDGPYLVFLSGVPANAYIFLSLGSRLSDQFHVIAMTRRGTGRSDKPESGYDAVTLVEDISGSCQSLGIAKAHFAGWSFAGLELTTLASRHPQIVNRLVYIDAAVDNTLLREAVDEDPVEKYLAPLRRSALASLGDYLAYRKARLPAALAPFWESRLKREAIEAVTLLSDGAVQMQMSGQILEQLLDTAFSFIPDYSKVAAPALAIYAMADYHAEKPASLSAGIADAADKWWRDEILPATRVSIDQFKAGIASGTVLELEETCHACFIQREDEVFNAMIRFLRN